MTTNPTPPADRSALRDRIADVLAAADGWTWMTDRDKARSSTYRSYQSRADAVLAVLPEPADQTALHRVAEAALGAVEAALGDTLVPAAREEALAGIVAVLPPPADRAAVLREAADAVAAHPGPIPYRPQLDEDGGFWWDTRDRDAIVALLRRMADETATTETQAAAPSETDEERADREETERDHARGDHTHCGITCEVEMPTEHLRNFVIAKGYPGTKGALAELERRAAAGARQGGAQMCGECAHPKATHREGDDPVSPGRCAFCPDDDAWHDYQPAAGAQPAPGLAAADNPTLLRWGLDDVLHGDDDTTTVLLSGLGGAPYWLELEPERAAALRDALAGPGDSSAKSTALDVLRCLADPEPCAWEGVYCVTHSWKSDIGLCPHGQAQALLGASRTAPPPA